MAGATFEVKELTIHDVEELKLLLDVGWQVIGMAKCPTAPAWYCVMQREVK